MASSPFPLRFAGLFFAGLAAAAPVRFASGPARVSLVELYTSEGCSSCPPAERFVGGLRTAPGLWRDFVPVAFHVDYWNGLGWSDRLSRPAFTDRQYAYGRSGAVHSIYTPCFIIDGREWEPRGRLPSPRGQPGILRVDFAGDGACRVAFESPKYGTEKRGRFLVQAALLGGGMASRVTAGENSGRTLVHEFAVLSLAQAPLRRAGPAEFTAELHLQAAAPEAAGPPRRALAVWVSRGGELAPLQAAGGWIGPP